MTRATALMLGSADGLAGARLRAQLGSLGIEDVEAIAPDLPAIAQHARAAGGDLVILHADIVTNTEALAGLLDDPRIASGVLAGDGAGAPVLGVLKVAAAQRDRLAAAAEQGASGDDVIAALADRLAAGGVSLRPARLRGLAWARAGTEPEARAAAVAADRVDEDRIRMDSAVKSVDGFFTTFFVSPYSRHIARWAARRGLTPNQVTVASFLLGILAAAGFATGERWGLVAGAILLQVAFTNDCVDGQLARYARRFSELGGWLDGTLDRAKEYLVFAGLAIGADRAGDPVWVLAGAALGLQTVRHLVDFSWQVARGDGSRAALGRWDDVRSAVAWVKRIVAFPIGERFALISITAAFWSARTTFVAWLIWAAFAGVYGLAGRILRARAAPRGQSDVLALYRDDGPIARALAPLGARLDPLALAVAALVPLVVAMAVAGAGAADGPAVAVVAWLVLAGGLTGGRTGTGRWRWLVPPLLRAGEYAGLLWLGTLAGATSIPAAFALLAALALRHYDIVYGLRYRGAPVSERLGVAAGGWDGRLALGCVLLVTDALPGGFYVLAAIIAVAFAAAMIRDWSRARMPVTFHDDEEDAQA